MDNDKIEKLKCDILGDFQTLCKCVLRIQSFIKIGQRSLILGYLNFRMQNTLHLFNFSCKCLNLWSRIKKNCSKFFMSHEHLRKYFFFQPEIMEDYLRKIPRKYEHVISKIEIINNNFQIVNCHALKRVFYFGAKIQKM